MAIAEKAIEPPKKLPAIPAFIDEPKLVKRNVHFHDLFFEFDDAFNPAENADKFLGFFSIIAKLAADKDLIRYQPALEGKVFMQDVKFDDAEKKITGKLLYVRMDVFPELIDILTDETEDIETAENKGAVETTHFVIDYSKAQKKIAIEVNGSGAKISEFMTYCQLIGVLKSAIKSINYQDIQKDELAKFKDRMGAFSTLTVRVHKDNIAEIEAIDKGIFSTLRAIKKQYQAEYVEIKLKFSYKKRKTVQKIKSNITNILTSLINDKKKLDLFDSLKVSALDKENNSRMKLFDLLVDKVGGEILVQRKPKHKVIISADAFAKIKELMASKKL